MRNTPPRPKTARIKSESKRKKKILKLNVEGFWRDSCIDLIGIPIFDFGVASSRSTKKKNSSSLLLTNPEHGF